MFCPKCGQQNIDDARFCMACGQKLSGSSDGAPAPDAVPGAKLIFKYNKNPMAIFVSDLLYVTLDNQRFSITASRPYECVVPPGPHRIQMSFPYLGSDTTGLAATELTVNPGDRLEISYKMPVFVFNPGLISILRV